jgi:hypothetical protein
MFLQLSIIAAMLPLPAKRDALPSLRCVSCYAQPEESALDAAEFDAAR